MDITSQRTDSVSVKIYNNCVKYGHLLVSNTEIKRKSQIKGVNINKLKHLSITHQLACGDYTYSRRRIKINVSGILAHYIIQELKISPSYRAYFISRVKSLSAGNKVVFLLKPAEKEIIDYAWNGRTNNLAWERVELDHTLSWLSTLGGAFSALGDYFSNCALIAGKISFHQLKLALRLRDPTIAARCRLYFSLSLIQRGHLKVARKIIYEEYHFATNAIVVDTRLVKMCLGIWAKLKYEFGRRNRRRRQSGSSVK